MSKCSIFCSYRYCQFFLIFTNEISNKSTREPSNQIKSLHWTKNKVLEFLTDHGQRHDINNTDIILDINMFPKGRQDGECILLLLTFTEYVDREFKAEYMRRRALPQVHLPLHYHSTPLLGLRKFPAYSITFLFYMLLKVEILWKF